MFIEPTERQKIIMLSQDWQLACPLYQERLRISMLQHPMPRQNRKDWVTDIFRDHPDIIYAMEAPYFDTIFRDDSGKGFENFLKGTYAKKIEFMRWADAAMKILHPELILFAREHEDAFLLPDEEESLLLDDEGITFH